MDRRSALRLRLNEDGSIQHANALLHVRQTEASAVHGSIEVESPPQVADDEMNLFRGSLELHGSASHPTVLGDVL